MNGIKATVIQISTIEDVKGLGFEARLIQDIDVVNLAGSNNDKGRDASSQIQESVQFYGSLVGPELGPREKRKAQIDGSGIQSTDRFVEGYVISPL